MIVFISKHDFLKCYKKLTKRAEYGILNGTDNDDIKDIGCVKNSIEDFSFLKAPTSLVKGKVDEAVREKKLKGYLKNPSMNKAAAIAAAAQLSENGEMHPERKVDKNVFVVLPDKTYDKLAPKIAKRWETIYGIDEDKDGAVVILFDRIGIVDLNETAKEVAKIDKRIDKLMSNLDAGIDADLWSDSDIKRTEKRVAKLRNERKKLKQGKIEGNSALSLKCKAIKKGAIKKSARKKLEKYCQNFYKHNKSDSLLSREY